MSFDFINFFNQHAIEYMTSGPSVTRGNVAIHCPMCGSDDESHHMGVSVHGKGWRCWRRPDQHSGRSPVRLVQALLGCTLTEAIRIAGGPGRLPQDLLSQVTLLLNPEQQSSQPREGPALPQQFRRLISPYPSVQPYHRYLYRRGYDTHDTEVVQRLDDYGLRYASHGPWKGRIIFPVYFNERLMSWTGRTIFTDESLRYRSLSYDPDKAKRTGDQPAVEPINHFLLWYDRLLQADADTLVLVEGPFDALHVDFLGEQDGIVASCLFTATPTAEQMELLYDLLPRFKYKYLLLDNDMLPVTLRIASTLISLGLDARFMPSRIKDPGERDMTRKLLRRTLAQAQEIR